MASNYPTTEWVEYGPDNAGKLLESNTRNRSLRRHLVDQYRRDMISEDWRVNGDTIKISKDGVLIDGQHRLAAIVEADDRLPRPIPILTVTGLDPEVMVVTDTGLKRTPGDALQLAGYRNVNNLSAMARGVIRLSTGREFKGQKAKAVVSNSELLKWLDDNPNAEQFVADHAYKVRQTNLTPGAGLISMWMLHGVDTWRAAEFIDSLVTLERMDRGSPIAALARTINRLRIDQTHVRQLQWVAMVFETWNAWLAEEPVGRLKPTVHNRVDFPWPLTREEALMGAESRARDRELDQAVLPGA